MNSGDLVPNDHDPSEPASNEVQFALVIARMIDTLENSPEHMRQAVYDLARYKLQEQFTPADAKDVTRTQQALETAIRGVEEFSKQRNYIPAPTSIPQLSGSVAVSGSQPARIPHRSQMELYADEVDIDARPHPLWPPIKRIVGLFVILGFVLLIFLQRERLAMLVQQLPGLERQAELKQSAHSDPAPKPLPAPPKPNPLRPADYGVYAIGNDSLTELRLLPGRPPDIRVAVSAALKTPSQTVLPNGHPKFIVFRRDAVANAVDRAEVRVIAKIAREFSAEAAGKKTDDSDATWVIRNVSFPFRASPMPDSPEMYEIHSEDPALELSPGRYALILKNQAYDFIVAGTIVDPRQCIERIIATSGTFYTDCKKP